jgi:hypothetical protein
MKRYRVVEWDDALIYLGPLAALLALSFLHWVVLLPAAAWAFIASRYFYPRWRTWRSIQWYAPGEWGVITNGAPVHSTPFNDAVNDALDWWLYNTPALTSRVGEGGIIAVYVQEEPLTDLRYPAIRARGLTDGNHIRLLWQPSTNGAGFYDVLKHEVGHCVLNSMEFQGDHHAEMKRLAYPWA